MQKMEWICFMLQFWEVLGLVLSSSPCPCFVETMLHFHHKECVAVFIELYKKNIAVSCFGSYTTEPTEMVTIHSGLYTGIPC